MHSAPQPFERMQQLLAAHWQVFYHSPTLRLSRWLTAAADQSLLHDYLLGLSTTADAPLHLAPAAGLPALATVPGASRAAVTWLLQPGADTEYWLRQQLSGGGTRQFIVLEDEQDQRLHRLARWYPAAVQTVVPGVSMAQLLREVQEATGSTGPEGAFRQQFQQLGMALAQTNDRAVATQAAACLQLCQNSDLPLADISIWLAVGPYFLVRQQPAQALEQYAAALARSEQLYAVGNAATCPLSEHTRLIGRAAGLLSVQAWLGQAVAWQQCRPRGMPQAIAVLQLALARTDRLAANELATNALAADTLAADTLGIEAARQLALALDRAGQRRPADDAYGRALALAGRLPSNEQSQALIRTLGAVCFKRLRTGAERQALAAQLELLCGSPK